jgi:hypothetical protein
MTEFMEPISPGGERAIDRLIGQSEGAKQRATQRGIASASNRTQLKSMEMRGQQFEQYQQHQAMMQDKQMQAQEREAQRLLQLREDEKNANLEYARLRAGRTREALDKANSARQAALKKSLQILKAKMMSQMSHDGLKVQLEQADKFITQYNQNRDTIIGAWAKGLSMYANRAAIQGDPGELAGLIGGATEEMARDWQVQKKGGAVTPEEAQKIKEGGMWKFKKGVDVFAGDFEPDPTRSPELRMYQAMQTADSLAEWVAGELVKSLPQMKGQKGEVQDAIRGLTFATMAGQGEEGVGDMTDVALDDKIAAEMGGKTIREIMSKSTATLEDAFPEIGSAGLDAIINGPRYVLQGSVGEDLDATYEYLGGNQKQRYEMLAAALNANGGSMTAETLQSFNFADIFNDLLGQEAYFLSQGGKLTPHREMVEMMKFMRKRLGTKGVEQLEGTNEFEQEMLDAIDMSGFDKSDYQANYLTDAWMMEEQARQAEMMGELSQIDTFTAGEMGGYVP